MLRKAFLAGERSSKGRSNERNCVQHRRVAFMNLATVYQKLKAEMLVYPVTIKNGNSMKPYDE